MALWDHLYIRSVLEEWWLFDRNPGSSLRAVCVHQAWIQKTIDLGLAGKSSGSKVLDLSSFPAH